MSSKSRDWRLRADRRGTSALEFALVLPPLLMLLLGGVAFGLFYFAETSLRFAVAQYARDYAISQQTGATFAAPATPAFLSQASLRMTATTSAASGGIRTITVTGSYPASLVIPFLPTTTGELTASTALSFPVHG